MNWTTVLIAIGVLALILILKRLGQISVATATQYLRDGAVVVDVRTPAEFNSGHLRGAINVPLEEMTKEASRKLRDREKVLLLHCQSGMRSGVAQKRLRAMGYPNAFNLGSYDRAARIVNQV